ncbi:hypothetical protein L484_022909 [Morus notabilis]|uniref:Uncharacterized protein n=1 Tax=Morus notabilis TaxID=981085 RepID=W9S914_9ROSA|nr:hypothetical protein L484_022909 [Morus notabilis]
MDVQVSQRNQNGDVEVDKHSIHKRVENEVEDDFEEVEEGNDEDEWDDELHINPNDEDEGDDELDIDPIRAIIL